MVIEKDQIAVIILNYFDTEVTAKCIHSVQKTLKSTIFLVDNSANHDERKRLTSLYQHQEDVEFNGGVYGFGFDILFSYLKRKDIKKGFIFNFNLGLGTENCEDDNIIRHPETKAPILF